jgi:hypothetical protein
VFDVRRYKLPPPAPHFGSAPVLTSLGCAKKCGYCSHGASCAAWYGSAYSRRSRPWRDVYRDLAAGCAAGIERFTLLADQFLSPKPEENGELARVADEWRVGGIARPILDFTVGPRETLNNLPLLEMLARAFRICPRLAIESFDDRTLALLELDFDSAMALEAFRALASLRLEMRVNYLLVRPGATTEVVGRELDSFLEMARSACYLSPAGRLLLAGDLFSGSLRVLPGSPVSKVAGEDYLQNLPLALLRTVLAAQASLEEQARALGAGPGVGTGDPLIEVVDTARRELG